VRAESGAVRRFSRLAGVTLVVVAATGVVRALDEVEHPGELLSTGYGRAVLLKAGLLVALAVLGAINRYRNVHAAPRSLRGLRRVGRAEVGVAVATLVAAAVLASLPPPVERGAAASAPQALVATGADFATTVRARLEVAPGVAGANTFAATLRDYDSGAPLEARRVSLTFTFLDDPGVSGSTLELRRAGPGSYRATAGNLAVEGRWQVDLLAQTGSDALEVPLRIATRCRARPLSEPGRVAVHVVDLPGGGAVQAYVDPKGGAPDDVHVTFVGRSGGERRVGGRLSLEASRSAGEPRPLEVRRFGPGHFVASGDLPEGEWRFSFSTTGRTPLRGCFEEEVSA
jgi:hypothetical protein